MEKFRKKPIVIEAFQLTYEMAKGVAPVPNWFQDAVVRGDVQVNFSDNLHGSQSCKIKTLEGIMIAFPDDYIIQGIQGEIYPCKSEIFKKTYELVVEENTDNRGLSYTQELLVKLRNRDKAIELMGAEIISLRLRVRDNYSEKDLVESLAECREKNAILQEQYQKIVQLTKEERKQFARDELIQRLKKQLAELEAKNKKLSNDNETLMNKFHTIVNKNPTGEVVEV